MKATIETPKERNVTLVMSESEAELLKLFFGRWAKHNYEQFVKDKKIDIDYISLCHLGNEIYDAINDEMDGDDK